MHLLKVYLGAVALAAGVCVDHLRCDIANHLRFLYFVKNNFISALRGVSAVHVVYFIGNFHVEMIRMWRRCFS